MSPPREVPTNYTRLDTGGHQDLQCIRHFDADVVVAPVLVPFRFAAPAIVEREDATRPPFVLRQQHRQFVKILRRPRKARKADDGTGRRGEKDARAIVPRIEAQAVRRGNEEILVVQGSSA